MKDCFSTYHPIINFTFFVWVLLFAMLEKQPVFMVISCVTGLCYHIYLKGRKAIKQAVLLVLPVFCVSAIFNPLFSHEGATILFYFKTGNPVTLESILYGMASGGMICSMILWFSCLNEVITSDKLMYLFGKVLPAMSLVLSMTLRFIPRFQVQITKISNAQKCVGRDVSNGNVVQKAGHGMRILSIMVTWALENSVETADSMKSRGYGLRGRSNFTIYRFDSRDKGILAVLLVLGTLVLISLLTDQVFVLYYPVVYMNDTTVWAVLTYLVYTLLCLMPIIIDVKEDMKWRYLQSQI